MMYVINEIKLIKWHLKYNDNDLQNDNIFKSLKTTITSNKNIMKLDASM